MPCSPGYAGTAGDAVHGRRPSYVGEYLRGTSELMAEQHRYAVQTVSFSVATTNGSRPRRSSQKSY